MTDFVSREQWVAALRSGKYQQCQDMLHNAADGYCCLGVLVRESFPELVSVYDAVRPESDDLWGNFPSWMTSSQHNSAILLNDRHNLSFSQIADWCDAGMPDADEYVERLEAAS